MILNCGGSCTSFAAADVVAEAVAETVLVTLLEVDIGSEQVQAVSAGRGRLKPLRINVGAPVSFVMPTLGTRSRSTGTAGPFTINHLTWFLALKVSTNSITRNSQ
jgi:hypothetical protein